MMNEEFDDDKEIVMNEDFDNDKDKLLACLLLYAGDEDYKHRVDSALGYFADFTNYMVAEYSIWSLAEKYLSDETGKALLQLLYTFATEGDY